MNRPWKHILVYIHKFIVKTRYIECAGDDRKRHMDFVYQEYSKATDKFIKDYHAGCLNGLEAIELWCSEEGLIFRWDFEKLKKE